MLQILATISLFIGVCGRNVESKPKSQLWSLDKDIATVGGCVIISIDLMSRDAAHVMLRVDGRNATRLVDAAGPTARLRNQTMVLISHDLFFPKVSKASDGTMTMIQIPPVFSQPGIVELTLEENGVSWGTKTVNVVAASPDAQRAIELLYPTAAHGDQSLTRAGRLMGLLINGTFGEGGGIDQRQELDRVREALPDLLMHPDWAEIFENLVAWQEIIQYRKSITTSEDDPPYRIKDEIDKLPPMPESVTRCLAKEPKSPFARKYKDNIHDLATDVRVMDARRRGEDIQEILKTESIRK